MLTFKEYKKVQSLAEAYELNQKKNNKIIAGGLWIKMWDRGINTAIDLSGLGLNTVTETAESFSIGCMTTLRELETHPGLNAYTNGAIRESIRHIVGVQFRNCATVGGSIFGRFGFSDLLTVFLAMDTEAELYHAGKVPLKDFGKMPYDNDILIALHVKKSPLQICYLSQRNTATDFPVVACAVSCYDNKMHVSIGARPMRAEVLETEIVPAGLEMPENAIADIVGQFVFGTNRRAGENYRKHVAGILTGRAIEQIQSQK